MLKRLSPQLFPLFSCRGQCKLGNWGTRSGGAGEDDENGHCGKIMEMGDGGGSRSGFKSVRTVGVLIDRR